MLLSSVQALIFVRRPSALKSRIKAFVILETSRMFVSCDGLAIKFSSVRNIILALIVIEFVVH